MVVSLLPPISTRPKAFSPDDPFIKEGVKRAVAKGGKIVLEDENRVTSETGGASQQ
jgi:hypothetical protein